MNLLGLVKIYYFTTKNLSKYQSVSNYILSLIFCYYIIYFI